MVSSQGNELGNFVRELRGNRTLAEVSRGSKLSVSFIRQIEVGLNAKKQPFKPKTESLFGLATYYQVPIEILLKKAGVIELKKQMVKLSGKEFEFIHLFQQVDIEAQEIATQLMRKMLEEK